MKLLRDYQVQAIKDSLEALGQSSEPVLLLASVGAGKSLIIAEILKLIAKHNKRALCLVSNAELVRNNAATYEAQTSNKASVYCSSLGSKEYTQNIVFATPQSVLSAIKKEKPIADIAFNLIVVDEAHLIAYHNRKSTFMRILRHYKTLYPSMRILGCTGTDYRYKGNTIVGDGCLFQHKVGNITTNYLINEGFLVRPRFDLSNLKIDFSQVKPKSTGMFAVGDLEKAIAKTPRLTERIINYTVQVMRRGNRFGCFVFASSIKHAKECLSYLPDGEAALITGETKQRDRNEILERARRGEIKYLVNVAVLTVGVDVPGYDTVLFVRPTESLVLLVQMLGRVLRLAPGKKDALVLDCAGNIDRHRDYDDPLLLDAIREIEYFETEKPFLCYECNTYNSMYARRCSGIVNGARCTHYFEFRHCHSCNAKNDIASRVCRRCDAELIDPNAKLDTGTFSRIEHDVQKMQMYLKGGEGKFTLTITYIAKNGLRFYENFTPCNQKAIHVFYGRFIKQHIRNGSKYYRKYYSKAFVGDILREARAPKSIVTFGSTVKTKIF